MNYKDFQGAITGAPQIAPPTTNPALASLFGSTFQLAQSNRGAQGLGAAASIQAQADAQAQEAARGNKAAILKDKIQAIKDQNDPSKYQKVKKDDGGFDFYDPTGNKIDIHQYAQVTGKAIPAVLKDSENNLDLQFQQDYKTMQDIADAYANGDKSYLEKLATDSGDPEFFKGKTAADVMKLFRNGYPNIYNTGTPGQNVRTTDQAPGFTGGGAAQEPKQNFLQQLLGLFGK
jgi:hypothetical protein